MKHNVLVAGGGIGGLACALALGRAGVPVTVLEQAQAFGEIGAGIQLGPNAMRVLSDWGVADALQEHASFPDELRVRSAHDGRLLGHMRLGASALAHYGHPYASVHRADLHRVLLSALLAGAPASLSLNARMQDFALQDDAVSVRLESGQIIEGEALVGCDGLWSRVRTGLLGPEPPRLTGHLAYRGMIPADRLPRALASNTVNAWLGPRMHVVHYPIRQGRWFNVVAVVHGVLGAGHGGPPGSDPQSWSHEARSADLQRALGPVCGDLKDMLGAVTDWKLWALNDRAPVASAQEHAQGRVALLGDAAHPLRPYLAQGAAMAIEDAWTLGRLLQTQPVAEPVDWPALFARYAQTRWQRNARVQNRSQRNGTIFHASGALRWARNASMGLLGESLLDNPWLYSGPPEPV